MASNGGKPAAVAAAVAVVVAVTAVVLVVVKPGAGATVGVASPDPAQLASLTAATSTPESTQITEPGPTTSEPPSSGPGSTTGAPPSTTANAPISVLRVGVTQLPDDPDPMIGAGTAPMVTSQVYDTLVALTPDQTAVVPGLAEKWTMNTAGSEWTLQLRSGVKFHDGTPLTPGVVCANFQHWSSMPKDKQAGAFDWEYYFGGFAGDSAMTYRNCSTQGEDTVKLSFAAPEPFLPAILALPTFGIAAPSTLSGGKPVGTGPFKWTSADKSSVALTAASPGSVGRIEFRLIPDSAAAANAVDSGQVDLAGPLIDGVRPGTTKFGTAVGVGMVLLDQTPGRPLADKNTRQAVSMALDPKALAEIIPGSEPVGSLLPPLLTGGVAVPSTAKPDVAAARKLLNGKSPTVTLLARGYRAETDRQVAEAMKAQLNQAGFKVELRLAKDVNEYLDAYDGKIQADLLLAPPVAYSVDPVDYLKGVVGYTAATGKAAPWRPEFDKMLDRVSDDSDPQQRVRAALDASELMISSGGAIPLMTRSTAWAVGKGVQVRLGGLPYFPLAGVTF